MKDAGLNTTEPSAPVADFSSVFFIRVSIFSLFVWFAGSRSCASDSSCWPWISASSWRTNGTAASSSGSSVMPLECINHGATRLSRCKGERQPGILWRSMRHALTTCAYSALSMDCSSSEWILRSRGSISSMFQICSGMAQEAGRKSAPRGGSISASGWEG